MSAAGLLWTAAPVKLYGLGRGRAHPSVEHMKCPVCHARPGALCVEDNGEPKMARHCKRAYAYQDLRRRRRRLSSS